MPANAIIRWLLSTGRTYTTVGKLQAALVEQLVEHGSNRSTLVRYHCASSPGRGLPLDLAAR